MVRIYTVKGSSKPYKPLLVNSLNGVKCMGFSIYTGGMGRGSSRGFRHRQGKIVS